MPTPVKWGDRLSISSSDWFAWGLEGPEVSGLASGGFAVSKTVDPGHVSSAGSTWVSLTSELEFPPPPASGKTGTLSSERSGSEVGARLFDGKGNPLGPDFQVNTTDAGDQYLSGIESFADGGFTVTWQSNERDSSGAIRTVHRAQSFDSDGDMSGDERIVDHTWADSRFDADRAMLPDGGYVVSWTKYRDTATGRDTHIRARMFDDEGNATGSAFRVNTSNKGLQSDSSIAVLAGGGFVVSWDDLGEDGRFRDNEVIRAQVFDRDGNKLGSELLVNSTTDHAQILNAVAALPDGRFVISWSDLGGLRNGTLGNVVRAQLFEADGSPSGSEFLIHDTPVGQQINTSISALADGRFVIVWDSFGFGSEFPKDETEVHGQIFDARTEAISLDGTANDDEFHGTAFDDDMSGGRGADSLSGGAGADFLAGQAGSDTLLGQTGNDLLRGGDGRDVLRAGNGDDRLFGNAGSDFLGGGAGADLLSGGRGDDILRGRKGDDILSGGIGNDRLIGGTGLDRLTGGAGRDSFIFATIDATGLGADSDVIMDFAPGVDKIRLKDLAPGQVFVADAVFSMAAGEVRYDAPSGILEGDIDGDGFADYQLVLTAGTLLTAGDLVL